MEQTKCRSCKKGLCVGCEKTVCGKHGKGEFCAKCTKKYPYGMEICGGGSCARYVTSIGSRGLGEEFFYCGSSHCFWTMF